MRIWLIDHYAVPTKYYPLARPSVFARKLTEKGHEVKIICASTVHNSNINLLNKKERSKEIESDNIKYYLIKCCNYKGNGIKRVFNMLEFAIKLLFCCKKLDKPDVIIATSLTQFACVSGIILAKKYNCKIICQIADLWPETLVSYGMLKDNNIIVNILRKIEKWIYIKSDRIVFLMEGAYDYIIEQHWENLVPREKISIINNGIDMKNFFENRDRYKLKDKDLDSNKFKVIYTGSIRKVNNVEMLLNIAKITPEAQFLIWGDGDERKYLEEKVHIQKINNVIFKGKVDKKYIPYIVSKANVNIAHNFNSPIFRFGISFNKIFDYFAAGKPIICDFNSKYNPVIINNAGIETSDDAFNISKAIKSILLMSKNEYDVLCKNALEAANKYDYDVLVEKLLQTICDIR